MLILHCFYEVLGFSSGNWYFVMLLDSIEFGKDGLQIEDISKEMMVTDSRLWFRQ